MNLIYETGGIKVTFTHHWYDPGIRRAQDLFQEHGVQHKLMLHLIYISITLKFLQEHSCTLILTNSACISSATNPCSQRSGTW